MWSRPSPERSELERRAASVALAAATVVQSVHFAEEAATGFHERLPALFGLPPIPFALFLGFNVGWIGIWILSVPGVRAGRSPAFFAAWFLAIAGIFNGVAHPLLAVASGGYFPGLVSSPFIAAASVWLWLRMGAATRPGGGG